MIHSCWFLVKFKVVEQTIVPKLGALRQTVPNNKDKNHKSFTRISRLIGMKIDQVFIFLFFNIYGILIEISHLKSKLHSLEIKHD